MTVETRLRALRAKDLPEIGLLSERAFPYDPVSEALVREKCLAAPDWEPDLGLVAEVDDRVAGYTIGCLAERGEEVRGWARLLAVDPPWRRRGIGSRLLEALERRLVERGARAIGILDGPMYLTPGVDWRDTTAYCFLEKNGYRYIQTRRNLRCSLGPEHFDLETERLRLRGEGVEVRRATPEDARAMRDWLAVFNPNWRFEVDGCMSNRPPTCHIARRGREIIGFAAYHGHNRTQPHFGPMGVNPTERLHGLGALLLRQCLNDLLALGWDWASIPWVGPVRFYNKSCGAEFHRVFWAFEKRIAPASSKA